MLESQIIACWRHPALPKDFDGRFIGQTDCEVLPKVQQQLFDDIKLKQKPEIIVSSPLKRCLALAHQLAEYWNIELQTSASIMEYDFGAWENRLISELANTESAQLTNFWNGNSVAATPNAESIAAFESRVFKAWESISELPYQRVFVMTHAGVIKAWFAKLFEIQCTPALMAKVSIDYGHCTIFKRDLTFCQLIELNGK